MTKLLCLQNNNCFYCDQCGLCCMNLDKNPILNELNRGDGICKHFNQHTKLCEIYTNRPLVCRVDEGYILFQSKMSKKEYYKLNRLTCITLKQNSLKED